MADISATLHEQALLNSTLITELCLGRWIWKSLKTKVRTISIDDAYPLHMRYRDDAYPLHIRCIDDAYPLHIRYIDDAYPLHIRPVDMEIPQDQGEDHMCVYICTHVCVYVCMHVCMYLFIIYLCI